MTPNPYKVQQGQWKKWSEQARGVFNSVYAAMSDQRLFIHPKAAKVSREHWQTTRWNAAWIAAEAVDENTKEKAA
jgi:hypothetical protein